MYKKFSIKIVKLILLNDVNLMYIIVVDLKHLYLFAKDYCYI